VPIPVILDCDPGTDDALAILLALASPELSVLAITVASLPACQPASLPAPS
jgi:inosine-uridine nucleoside N-ribohydrolase